MSNIYIKFHKIFYKGDQYIRLNVQHNEIIDDPKQYYWQERKVYNHVASFVDLLKAELPQIEDKDLFGKEGFVSKLYSLQIKYNELRNNKYEFITKTIMGTLLVEDGSIDMDTLEEEGLAPGKILVYRKGSVPPTIINNYEKDFVEMLNKELSDILQEMNKIYVNYKFILKEKYNKRK